MFYDSFRICVKARRKERTVILCVKEKSTSRKLDVLDSAKKLMIEVDGIVNKAKSSAK